MNPTEPALEAIANRLRARVAEGRYHEAQADLQQYALVLREVVARLSPGDPALSRLQGESRRLIEESRRSTLAGRAQAGSRLSQLARLQSPSRPYGDPSPPRRTFQWLA